MYIYRQSSSGSSCSSLYGLSRRLGSRHRWQGGQRATGVRWAIKNVNFKFFCLNVSKQMKPQRAGSGNDLCSQKNGNMFFFSFFLSVCLSVLGHGACGMGHVALWLAQLRKLPHFVLAADAVTLLLLLLFVAPLLLARLSLSLSLSLASTLLHK